MHVVRFTSHIKLFQVHSPRFVTDEFPGDAKGGDGTKPEEARIKDELGWSLRYTFSGSCTTVNVKEP